MAAPPPPNMPNLQLFFGPMLIGVFLNTILYGALVVQLYIYFQTYKSSDRPWLRYLIIYLLVMDTFSTISLSFMMYDTLINKMLAGPPSGPPKPPMLLSVDAVVIVLISTPVQLFLAWRIHTLAGSTFVTILIGTLAIISFGGGISITVLVTIFPDFSKFRTFIPAATTWLVSSALADILITASLIVTLYRKRTGMLGVDSVLNKIIIFTVQTGLITAVFALADAILFFAMPNTGFNFIPDFALSKLYTNTFLASLNARVDRGAVLQKPGNRLYVDKRSTTLASPSRGACFTTISSPLDITGVSQSRWEADEEPPRIKNIEHV